LPTCKLGFYKTIKLILNELGFLNKIIKFVITRTLITQSNYQKMRKADLINQISEKTGIPKVDVLVTLETMFKEVKESLAKGENIYIRGFGSFITKKRAAKIGRNIKKNVAVNIPEHYVPAFKPAKEFVQDIKDKNQARKEEE
jgi:DNA-binding protein HU-beta